MDRHVWWVVCAVLWTATISTALFATVTSELVASLWAVIIALMASSVTTWIIADCVARRERARVDVIAKAVAREIIQAGEVTRIQQHQK